MRAKSYSEINDDALKGIAIAAKTLGEKPTDVEGYFLAGGDWDAETPEELADLIVECWREQEATN